jgi:hypothetical protein
MFNSCNVAEKIAEMIFDAENYKNGESVEMYNIKSIGKSEKKLSGSQIAPIANESYNISSWVKIIIVCS